SVRPSNGMPICFGDVGSATSHSRVVPSTPPLTSAEPAGANATEVTDPPRPGPTTAYTCGRRSDRGHSQAHGGTHAVVESPGCYKGGHSRVGRGRAKDGTHSCSTWSVRASPP